MTTGPDYMVLADYAQMTLDQQNREMKRNEQEQEKRKALVNSGLVSALDLEAPNSPIAQYNRAVALMKEQKSKEALSAATSLSFESVSLTSTLAAG